MVGLWGSWQDTAAAACELVSEGWKQMPVCGCCYCSFLTILPGTCLPGLVLAHKQQTLLQVHSVVDSLGHRAVGKV